MDRNSYKHIENTELKTGKALNLKSGCTTTLSCFIFFYVSCSFLYILCNRCNIVILLHGQKLV